MARIIQKSGDCPTCGQRRLCEKKAPRHGMHAVLFCATGGLSAATSMVTYAGRALQGWRCQNCGSQPTAVYE